MLPFKGTFPISNLIPGLILRFFKDSLFQKLCSHFLGFYFLFYFPFFLKKNKISGDSTFFKNQIFTNKKRVSLIEWGRTWKIRVHTFKHLFTIKEEVGHKLCVSLMLEWFEASIMYAMGCISPNISHSYYDKKIYESS